MRGSVISLRGVPLGLGAGTLGTEFGYNAVRTEQLHDALEQLGYVVEDAGPLTIPQPRGVGDPKAKFLAEIADTCERLAQWVEEQHERSLIPLAIGGDHSMAAGSVAGSSSYFRRSNERIGLIWVDAHADMNTPETTPSGNVHGMPLAACLGLGPRLLTHLRGFAPKVLPRNTVLVGIRDIDHEESLTIERTGVRAFTTRDIDERGMFSIMHEAIEHATDGTCGIHLSLDLDALDPSIAPGVGTPVPGGLTYREAHLALEMLSDTDTLLSMDCVEVNPMLDAQNLTAKMAVGLIASALGKRILPRGYRTPSMR